MKFQTYLVSWNEYYKNSYDIELQLKNLGISVNVINSGSPREGWNNVGDIRYFRQFYYALKDFNFDNDYMLFICGDVSYDDWSQVINRAINVLSSYEDIYLYAPHFTNDPWGFNSTNLKVSKVDSDLSIATNTNGIMFFMHKEIVKDMLGFFDYFQDKYGWETMVSGWAIDLVHSAFAISKNKIIIRDSKNIVKHPAGSSYNHSKATEETALIYKAFNEYSKDYSHIVDKIYGRMSHDQACMLVSDFYKKDFDLVKKKNNIDYHIIYINDERKSNRDLIDTMLNGYKHSIQSVNAKDYKEKEEFFALNKDFRLSWDEFKDGEIGNFASHYLAWKYVIQNNLKNLLIFEDDAYIDDLFLNQYNLFLQNCPQDYDVFSIFVDSNQFPRFTDNDIINNNVAKGYQDWSTLCYVISNSGAKKLVEYVKKNGMDRPTDWFIFRNGHEGNFNVYTFPPGKTGGVYIDGRYKSQVQ